MTQCPVFGLIILDILFCIPQFIFHPLDGTRRLIFFFANS
jgi:hypothetical protein